MHGEKTANEGRGTNRYTYTLSNVTHALPVRASRRAVGAVSAGLKKEIVLMQNLSPPRSVPITWLRMR